MSELKVPEVGESISEVRVARWLKRPGEEFSKDEDLVELETDKASVTVPAPDDGVLGEVLKPEGESARVGEVLAHLEPAKPREAAKPSGDDAGPREERPEAPRGKGNGSAGREVVVGRRPSPEAPQSLPREAQPVSRPEERRPLSPLRKAAAESLAWARREMALLTTFNEVDLTQVQEARRRYRETFERRHGVTLGLMPFFVKAVVRALRAVPELNAVIDGGEVVYRRYYDLGVAVSGGKGLVVPVLRGADQLGFAELERSIDDFARRARESRLKPDDLSGGTFTITNGGVFGSLLSTPIVRPPQSGILGMHAIEDRPVAREGQVVIRPMMYLALTYDHRLIDGREAVGFLRRVKEAVEDPLRLALDV